MPGLDRPRVLFTSGFAETVRYTEATATLDVPILRKAFTVDTLRDAVDRMLIQYE
jgi:hypothetical protein